MLNEVQKKIHGQRSEPITPIEINKLFQSPVTPEFNLIIYRALQRQVINADVTILQAIPRAKTREYLISIALCLRFGADANMYVNAPQLGTIHILGYVYSILGGDQFSDPTDEDVLNTIVFMLIAQGSRPSLPMFDRKAGKIRGHGEETLSSLTVIEWLNTQGYQPVLNRVNIGDVSELQQVLDVDSLAILSTLLDNPALMVREYEPRDMLLAIRAFSHASFDRIPTPETKVLMDFTSLDDAITYVNSEAYEKLIKRGLRPSYLLINRILLNMRDYRTKRIIAFQELQRMLLSSISVGTQLDQDQLNIISTMGRDILDSVMREYEQPYWRKVCNLSRDPKSPSAPNLIGEEETPEPLRRLAIALNIDPNMSRAAICESINTLSKADKEALKEAARRRQQLRIAGDLGTMNEFLNNKTPILVCRNKGLLPHDPLDYNDADLAYYRDDQGAVWCFSSDSFASLLESGVNPYNSTALPDSFKDELRYRIGVLKRLGIDATRGEVGIYAARVPVTFTQTIDSLTAKDVVSERTSAEALETFTRLASQHGLSPETIRTLSKERMEAALNSIGYEVKLAPLSTAHALVTTARIVAYIHQTDPEALRAFFDSLNTASSF